MKKREKNSSDIKLVIIVPAMGVFMDSISKRRFRVANMYFDGTQFESMEKYIRKVILNT